MKIKKIRGRFEFFGSWGSHDMTVALQTFICLQQAGAPYAIWDVEYFGLGHATLTVDMNEDQKPLAESLACPRHPDSEVEAFWSDAPQNPPPD